MNAPRAGRPTLFALWACAGVPPETRGFAPKAAEVPWSVERMPGGVRVSFGPVPPRAEAMEGALAGYHQVAQQIESALGVLCIRKRVSGLHVPLPEPVSPALLRRACGLAAPLVSAVIPHGSSGRLVLAAHGRQLRVGWSGAVDPPDFDAGVPLSALAIYLALRDLRWGTLPPGLTPWSEGVRPYGDGFQIEAIDGGPPAAPLWRYLSPQLRQLLPEEAIYQATRMLDVDPWASPLKRIRSFLFGDTQTGDGGRSILDDRGEFVALLRRQPLFEPLTDRELRHLVESGRQTSFGAGMRLVTQGEHGRSVLVLTWGRVAVDVDGAEAESTRIVALEAGSTFGEECLLTGAPRSATVRALSFVEALEIDRSDLLPLLLRRPEVVRHMAERSTPPAAAGGRGARRAEVEQLVSDIRQNYELGEAG